MGPCADKHGNKLLSSLTLSPAIPTILRCKTDFEGHMPIGEFGRPPALPGEGSAALTTPMYWIYEMGQASLNPARAVTDATKILFQNPLNPWSHTELGKAVAAGCELFERTTRRYGKPEWGLRDTEVNGVRTPIEI